MVNWRTCSEKPPRCLTALSGASLILRFSWAPTPATSVIRARTKRDVTDRFLKAIAQEQERRRENPHLQAAAGESLSRAFMEVARHRLPGATFDSLLQEALVACENRPAAMPPEPSVVPITSETLSASDDEGQAVLPVVLSPDL